MAFGSGNHSGRRRLEDVYMWAKIKKESSVCHTLWVGLAGCHLASWGRLLKRGSSMIIYYSNAVLCALSLDV